MRVFAHVNAVVAGEWISAPKLAIEVPDLRRTALEPEFEAAFRKMFPEAIDIAVSNLRVPLRTLKALLETYVNDHPETSLHWINVVGEDSLQPVATAMISLDSLEKMMFNVIVQQGRSEGTLLYVAGQTDRFVPESQVVLLQCKSLHGVKRAIAEIEAIMQFFDTEAWRNPELTAKASPNFGQS